MYFSWNLNSTYGSFAINKFYYTTEEKKKREKKKPEENKGDEDE